MQHQTICNLFGFFNATSEETCAFLVFKDSSEKASKLSAKISSFADCIIFTFNKHFDKENDCVHEPVITKPHHWCRLFITFYIVNFLLFKNKNSTYLMK